MIEDTMFLMLWVGSLSLIAAALRGLELVIVRFMDRG